MTIKELCKKYKYTQTELSKRFDIPLRTVSDWYHERRFPPPYVVRMIEEILNNSK